jgi:hypothetical protein
MTVPYMLIILSMTTGSFTPTITEFSNEKACDIARTWIQAAVDDVHQKGVLMICLPKEGLTPSTKR